MMIFLPVTTAVALGYSELIYVHLFYLQAAQMSQLFSAPPHLLTCTAFITKRTKTILILFNVTEPRDPSDVPII